MIQFLCLLFFIMYNKPILKKSNNSFNVLLKKHYLETENNLSQYINLPKNTNPLIIIDDVFSALKKIPNRSISIVVTSPPYWNLRDYQDKNQIGNENDPQEYVDKLIAIGNEILRILKDDGAYFLNVGDTYVDKNLQMIPQKIAIGMQSNGWLLRNQIIWYKPDHMPSPVKKRFTNTYEPIFFFTKNDWEKKVYFDIDKIRIPHKTNNNQQLKLFDKKYNGKFKNQDKNIGASPGGRISVNGEKYTIKRKIDVSIAEIACFLKKHLEKKKLTISKLVKTLGEKEYQHKCSHWFRKDAGASYPSINDWWKLKKILQFEDRYDKQMTTEYKELQVVKNHPNGKNPGDLFVCNTAKSHYKHFAMFPKEIPELAILSCCPDDGIVLDPFAGSGTTGIVAKQLNKKSILIDIQNNFIEIMKDRIGEVQIL